MPLIQHNTICTVYLSMLYDPILTRKLFLHASFQREKICINHTPQNPKEITIVTFKGFFTLCSIHVYILFHKMLLGCAIYYCWTSNDIYETKIKNVLETLLCRRFCCVYLEINPRPIDNTSLST